jgi:hypothetical protein
MILKNSWRNQARLTSSDNSNKKISAILNICYAQINAAPDHLFDQHSTYQHFQNR